MSKRLDKQRGATGTVIVFSIMHEAARGVGSGLKVHSAIGSFFR